MSNDVKEETPKFTGVEPLEVLFMPAKNQFALNKRHELLDSEDGIQLAFETASRSLMEGPLESWEEAVDGLRTSQTNTKPGCEKCWKELFKEECGESAHENQLDCMEGTSKPKDMQPSTSKKLFP